MHAVWIHQQDGSERTRPLLLDYPAQRIKDFFKRHACGDHLEQLLLTCEQSLGPLPFSNIPDQGKAEFAVTIPEESGADLDGKGSSIFPAVTALECHDFPCVDSINNAFQECWIRVWIEVLGFHPDQFFSRITQGITRLAVHIND